jgi:hypothetical protein
MHDRIAVYEPELALVAPAVAEKYADGRHHIELHVNCRFC